MYNKSIISKLESRKSEYPKYLLLLSFILFSLLMGWVFSLLIWNHVTLPYQNPYSALGKLTLAKFNPMVNSVRWGISIIMPTLIFIPFLFHHFSKKIIWDSFNDFRQRYNNLTFLKPPKKEREALLLKKFANITILLLIFVPAFLFFQKDFTTEYFDFFHEGVELTPAFNYISGKGVWSGTLFVRGAFHDLFTAIAGWRIFGVTSIGAYRVFVDILKLTIPITLGILLYAVWTSFNNKLYAFYIVQFMLLFYLGTQRIQNFDRRDAPLLLGIACLIFAINNRSKILFFVSGLFSALCTFYSLDMGIYFSMIILIFIILAIFIHLFPKKELWKAFSFLLVGAVIGWIIFYLSVGSYEFSAFINNFQFILHSKDLLDSYVYPMPNILKSARFSVPIIASSLNFLIYFMLLFSFYIRHKQKTEGIIHGILTAISLIHYRSALGRSDVMHIEYSSSLIFITLGLNIALGVLFIQLPKRIEYLLLATLILLNCTLITLPVATGINMNNLLTFGKRLEEFVHEDDLAFINKDRREGVTRLREIFAEESCVFTITSEALTPYLLKKPSCGPLYISYFASVEPQRTYFLNDLKIYDPKYIIVSTRLWTQSLDKITNYQRFPNLMKYVENRYEAYENVSDYWEVYTRKN